MLSTMLREVFRRAAMAREYRSEVASLAVGTSAQLDLHVRYLEEFWGRLRGISQHEFADLRIILRGDFYFTIVMATKSISKHIRKLRKTESTLYTLWNEYARAVRCLQNESNPSKDSLEQCYYSFLAFKKALLDYRSTGYQDGNE